MTEHLRELDRIADSPASPTFENTLEALEASGTRLEAVSLVFVNLTSANTSESLQKVETRLTPRFAEHRSAIYLNEKLFRRIDTLKQNEESLGLKPEQSRLLEIWWKEFVREGAKLEGAARARFKEISIELAQAQTCFAQNGVKDMGVKTLILEDEAELAGLPAPMTQAARELASRRGEPTRWHFALNEPTVMAFLTQSTRRDLRRRFYELWKKRGQTPGDLDNRPLIGRILKLRQEQARLLGFESYARYALEDTMAKSPEAARELLQKVWEPAKLQAIAERAEMTRIARETEGAEFQLEAWDWSFYSEKLRVRNHSIDEESLRNYFPLPGIIDAAFETASRLFGLKFRELHDHPRYHPDVRAWEVTDEEGDLVGIFLGDYIVRPGNKKSGAWMSSYRLQRDLPGVTRPVIVNCCNFSAPADGKTPSLLTIGEVRTLFHELGHGLHGLLSRSRYVKLAGTQVLRDFVEFPSQVLEHWALTPELLRKHARHHATHEPIPEDLIEKLHAAARLNQGFETVEYIASALADLDLHELEDLESFDPDRFEAEFLVREAMPPAIHLRHRLPHFQHVFSSPGYASKYYVYLWAGVLDADGYGAFIEAGDPFAPAPAKRLKEHVYSRGNSVPPMEAYIAFRGRAPTVDPLLRKKGLLAELPRT